VGAWRRDPRGRVRRGARVLGARAGARKSGMGVRRAGACGKTGQPPLSSSQAEGASSEKSGVRGERGGGGGGGGGGSAGDKYVWSGGGGGSGLG